MISVIGAGPAGSHAAYLLAKEGYKVNLYEDHSIVGIPIQCTGITTGALLDVINLDKSLIMNEITTYRIISPDNNELYFKLRKRDIVFDRSKFDQHISEEAVNAGAKLHLKSKFNGLENNGKLKIKINNEVNETEYLIGADGPSSLVAKSAGIYGKRRFIVG
ncbi:NAD(P)/FAD-dependent oxidoreductase [Candidatus Woesearchaeota archaeon]|nr:NAD(P)/FAD-dependent oxidoreductase [Candidatus Woesearchaeota archaeon]